MSEECPVRGVKKSSLDSVVAGILTGGAAMLGYHITPDYASALVKGAATLGAGFLGYLSTPIATYPISNSARTYIDDKIRPGFGFVGTVGGATLAYLAASSMSLGVAPLIAAIASGALIGRSLVGGYVPAAAEGIAGLIKGSYNVVEQGVKPFTDGFNAFFKDIFYTKNEQGQEISRYKAMKSWFGSLGDHIKYFHLNRPRPV
jgi:hypothetical protein